MDWLMVKWWELAPTCVSCMYVAEFLHDGQDPWWRVLKVRTKAVKPLYQMHLGRFHWLADGRILQIISFVWGWFLNSALFWIKHIRCAVVSLDCNSSCSPLQACRRPLWWPRLTWSRPGCRWQHAPVRPPTAGWWTVSGRFSERRDLGPSGKELEVMFTETFGQATD